MDAAQLTDGSFRFTDASGEVVFSIPALRMWDSTRTEDGMPKRETVVDARLVRDGGQLMLEVAPSGAWLADEATVYPVTVDPDVTAAMTQVRDTWVQQGVTGGRGADPKLFTGLVDGNIARSFVAYDTSPLNNAKIIKAELKLFTSFTGSCTPSSVFVRPVTEAWENATTVWTNQPAFSSNDAYLGQKSFAYGNSAEGCPADKWGIIDVTKIVVERTDSDGVMEVDHGMRIASLEGSESKRHTFCSDNPGAGSDAPCDKSANRPKLVVTYNKAPNVPTGQATVPARTCATGPAAPTMPTTSPTLNATVSDPDGGLVYGNFEVALASDESQVVTSGTSAAVNSGSAASWKPGQGKLSTGVTYAWRVRSYDQQRYSSYTGWCEFTVSLPAPVLDPPSTLHSTGAELSWQAYTNPDEPITEYQVHRSETANFTPSAASLVASLAPSATSYTDTTAEPLPATAPSENVRTYYYVLAVKTDGGTLVPSAVQDVALPKAGRITKLIRSSVTDTTLASLQPSTNLDSLGGQPAVEVGNNHGTYGTERAVVKFADLSAVPAGVLVVDADLGMWATGNSGSGAGFDAHTLTRGFAETTATWNQAATGTAWTAPGGDFGSARNTSAVSISGSGARARWDLGSAVNEWIATPSSNHGLAVKTAVEALPTQRVAFAASEAASVGERPRLEVTYVPKTTESTYYAPHTPQMMVPNRDETVVVTVTNTTSTSWTASSWALSYHWRRPDGTPFSEPSAAQSPGVLSADVPPGESADVTVTVAPPVNSEKGRSEWILAWDMRKQGQGSPWLSELEPAIPPLEQRVTVADPENTFLGLEGRYQYEGQPTGAGSAAMVNLYSGNAVWNYDAFSNPGRGVNTFVRMTYNSFDRSNPAMGYGWSLSTSTLHRMGTPLQFGPKASGKPLPGSVYLTDGDGSIHTFDLNTTTDEYEHPAGVHLYLARTGTSDENRAWVATAPDRTKFYFDEEGYHTATVDRNGNTLSLAYERRKSNNKPREFLQTITDPESRTSLRVEYYTKNQSYTYIDGAGNRQPGTGGLTDPDIIDQVESVTDISGRKISFYYTNTGLMAEMVDAEGDAQAKTFKFTYDPTQTNTNTKLIGVEDPRQHQTQLAYWGSQPDPMNHWKVESITDRATVPGPGVTRFTYVDPDAQAGGEIDATVEDAELRSTAYTLDAFGRPVEVIDAKSRLTKLTWDDDHNVVLLEEPAAAGKPTAKTQWAYDQQTGYPLVMIDPVANGANAEANPVTSTEPRTIFSYTFGPGGHVADLTAKTSPNGSITASSTDFRWNFGYDPNGNLTSVTDPEGVATGGAGDYQSTYTYDAQGNLTGSTDANANATTYTDYDPNGYPGRITDAEGHDTWFDYDARGNVTSVTDANENSSNYTYDVFGRPLESRVPKSDTEMIISPAPVYDRNDNVEKAYAPYINTAPNPLTEWSYVYDEMDQLDEQTEPKDDPTDQARVTDYGYDKVGNLTRVVEPKGTLTTTVADDFTTSYLYDTVYQLEQVTDADDKTTIHGYDGAGNLTTTTDPNGHTDTFDYDLAHRVVSATDADGGTPFVTHYDHDGRVDFVTDEKQPTPVRTSYGYDMRGLVTQVTVPHVAGDASQDRVTRYQYDEVGNRTAVVSPRGAATADPDDFTTRSEYDPLNRVSSRLFPYDPADALPGASINTQEAAGQVDYSYDKVGNLESVSAPPSAGTPAERAVTSYTYWDNGTVRSSTDPWEIVTSYDYNAMGRQTRRAVTPGGETEGSTSSRIMTWGYTPDGKLASRRDEGAPSARRVVVVDNSDKQNVSSVNGTSAWDPTSDDTGTKTHLGYDYETHPAATGGSFTWDLVVPKAGTYQVFARYGAEASATAAKYTVHHASGSTQVSVNQSTGAGTWKQLGAGTFTFAKGAGKKVVLTDATAGGVVAADAVKLVRTNTETDDEHKEYRYDYDPNANLTRIDDLSRPTPAVSVYDVTHTELNQVASVTEKAGTTPRKTTSLTYDPVGLLKTVHHNPADATAPDQFSTYVYGDPRDLLTQVTTGVSASDPNAKTTTFGYDERRLRDSQTKPNGNTVDYSYYADRLLADSWERRSTGADVARHQLTYTRNGHRERDVTRVMNADDNSQFLAFTRVYSYDPRDRIRNVEKRRTSDNVLLEEETYVHDAAGNLDVATVEEATTDYHYDRNRLLHATTTVGAASTTADYNYDPWGRLDTVTNRTTPGQVLEGYDYDGYDRTTRHTKLDASGGTVTTDYAYDPFDRTATRTREPGGAAQKITHSSYLGLTDTLLAEGPQADGANPAKTYTYTPGGQRLAQTKHLSGGGTELSYYGYNPHTDVETLTKPDGTTRATYGYTAYGSNDEEAFTGVDKPDAANPVKEPYNAYRYTAKRWDEASGNLDMGFRDYSPSLNRFLTLDSYNGALDDQQLTTSEWTGNRYTLAAGNPITGIEIDGHEPRPWHNFDGSLSKTRFSDGTRFSYDKYHASEGGARIDAASDHLMRSEPPGSAQSGSADGGSNDFAHLVLDVAGLVPVIGEPADAANCAWYGAEGDALNAGLSCAAVLPIIGWGAAGAKATIKGAKAANGGRRSVAIGEDMTNRVEPFAKKIGADTYKADPTAPREMWMKNNRDWIRKQMDDGCTIYDCGPAPGRSNFPNPTSPYYQMELDEIGLRNYPFYIRVPLE